MEIKEIKKDVEYVIKAENEEDQYALRWFLFLLEPPMKVAGLRKIS